MKPLFNIDDYLVDEIEFERPNIPVCIPRKPFQIEAGTQVNAYLVCHENKWFLVNSALANKLEVKNLYKATLYKGIFQDGELFLLPVTLPNNQVTSWYDSWLRIVKLATKKWLMIEKNSEEGCYEPVKLNSKTEPAWPELAMDECIQYAFHNRLINDLNHPVINRSARKSTYPEIEEEDNEFIAY